MIDKELLIEKMKERRFTVYSRSDVRIQFVSSHMYESKPAFNRRTVKAIINILVKLEDGNFRCIYNVPASINILDTSWCGSVLDDKHFDNLVSKFESHANLLERFCGGDEI